MSPSSDTPHRQRSWYHFHVTAWVAVAIVACALIVGNLWPCFHLYPLRQMNGWPLVHLLADVRIPGDLTVYYAPWPFGAPMLEFRPIALAVDVLAALALLASTALTSEYWLRRRAKPSQYSLRTLMGVVAMVAVVCSLLQAEIINIRHLVLAVLYTAIAGSLLTGGFLAVELARSRLLRSKRR